MIATIYCYPSDNFTCHFESPDACEIVQSRADDFDWSYGNDTTPSLTTGPTGGEDGENGFLYIEASDPQGPGDMARYLL